MVTNPFAFGKVVRGENFCDRKSEMEKVRAISQSKNNLIIVSPRRYGKTSLVLNALEKYTVPFIFIDCFEVANETQLLEKITSAYLQALRKGDVLEKLKCFSKSLHLEYTFAAKGISVHVTRHDHSALGLVLQEATKKHILVMDEFHELFEADAALVKKLRSTLQLLPGGTIFLGSKKHLLLYLFSDQRSPLYNFGEIMYLPKIPEEHWLAFVAEKFRGTKLRIAEQEIKDILVFSELIPFYVQYLFSHYWEEKRKNQDVSSLIFLETMLRSHAHLYEELFMKLPRSQKKALRSVAQETTNLFSAENTGGVSSQALHKALLSLCEKGFLERNGSYQFNDPLFKRWMQAFPP